MALSRHASGKKGLFFFVGFNAVTRFAMYILDRKVDLARNVTSV